MLSLAIIRQNRWLFLLLVLFPWAMSLAILIPRGTPESGDLLAILHSESLYALPLVGVNACALLGNEQRSRRILIPLSRAVGRGRYLLALMFAVLIPGALYVLSFIGSGELMLARAQQGTSPAVWLMAMLQAVLMVWFTAAGILFSVILPALPASAALWISAAAFFLLARNATLAGMPALVLDLLNSPLIVRNVPPQISGIAILSTLLQSALLTAAAIAIFRRRDLDLKSE